MFNSTPEPEQRRRVVNAAGLNGFLTKMYGFVGLSVFVSAISSFLVMTTFRAAVFGYFTQHTGMMWLLLLLPIALSMGISASATRNPTGSFIMLMVLSIMYGVEFALLAGVYTGADITAAFVSSAAIFIVMALYGTLTKRSLDRFGAHAMAALIALILASLINMFLHSPAITYIFSYIAVIIFVVLTAYDAQKMKNIYLNYQDQVSVTGLAIMGALQLYLDFINLFIQLLQIFGMGSDRRD